MKEVRKEWRITLLALRAAYISIISFLLISPFILSLDPDVEKPILIYAQDKSESIAHLTDSSALKDYIIKRNAFLESCADDFDVQYFEFGEVVHGEFTSDTFDQRLTNYDAFLKEIEDRYENTNVAMLVMSSDGLYNRGRNPMYASSLLPYPLYTLGLGDTLPKKDAWIEKVSHNKLAFLGNTFDVDVIIGASILNSSKTKLRISRNGREYASKSIQYSGDDFNSIEKFTLNADELGLLRFEVELISLEQEVSDANNKKYFYIDVLEGQQEVLIVSASPHPDVAALKASINSSKNFKARSVKLKEFDGNTKSYNLLILNQLPASSSAMFRNIAKSDIPKLYILGKATSVNDFNKLKTGLEIARFRNRYNDVTVKMNEAFQYFSLNHEKAELIESFPPLIAPFGDYLGSKESSSLYFQQIGKVATNYPLISFYEENGVKTGVIAGEGLWRWKLFDFRQNGSNRFFDGLMQKIVQYMSLREDKSRFRVAAEPSYFENNDIVINAEFYDKTYELENDHNAELTIKDDEGNVFEYSFLRNNNAYQVDLGKLNVGEYTWNASLNDGKDNFRKSGNFSIKALQLEKNSLKADHNYLYNLSKRNGGELIYPNDLEKLLQELKSNEKFKPVLHYNERLKELISFKWLFVMLLIAFSSEWFIRKYLGLY